MIYLASFTLMAIVTIVPVQTQAPDLDSLRKSAENGNLDSQSKLCFAYTDADNHKSALQWCRKAAEQGDANAQSALSFAYRTGWDVPQDNVESFVWARKAAEQGYAPAQADVCFAYGTGNGTPQNYALAVEWCRKASEQGDPMGQAILGSQYLAGQGVSQNYEEAYFWLNLALAANLKPYEVYKLRDATEQAKREATKHLNAEQITALQARCAKWSPHKQEQ